MPAMTTQAVSPVLLEELKKQLQEELREEMRRELFGETSEQDRPDTDYPWIVFSLDQTEYGINSKYVLSIEILKEVTPIVDAQCYCPGITESRGELIELLDLRTLFNLGDYITAKHQDGDDRCMMAVIETQGVKRGMIVDHIVAVEYLDDFVSTDFGKARASTSKYILQVAKRERGENMVLILNADALGNIA